MALQIYNTLTRGKAAFHPIEPGKIRMYVCGNTVYDYAHIGHARVMVAFDVIVRYLRARGWDVTYARNITDIDDKIINRARENGEPFTALTARMIEAQHRDEKALGVLPPDIEPRATEHIDDIIDMVQNLIDNHYAYRADNGDVYYRVRRFPDYGKLSGRNPEELLAGARVEVDEAKEDPRDFALWKAAGTDEPGWNSPWGWGRPGWHIECSAMSPVAGLRDELGRELGEEVFPAVGRPGGIAPGGDASTQRLHLLRFSDFVRLGKFQHIGVELLDVDVVEVRGLLRAFGLELGQFGPVNGAK
jgi:cysteinyl-tRNA synthetase